ncbi:conserved hypothetical protein [Histoplasma capsulatum G186AR]|uniref:GDP/GTP exchange factor Sec2 N-terminal domain-containing protein n=2 Tax=Ajellomyces capsulatus TaxID=5037 RepID=C0NWM5_AJECG|nr:uncharacterized protein HCBG_07555 [Histoplasma capsulatum G186AR]EEH04330.1 conserved hypothetical protein [Histoplasma capsulatum G186AR]KAG5291288.1 hypothetical protein I7I52_08569 [Histoplasma capsulatum]QSS68591.1 hypothetical protein I7I50_08053 [Histoplasma capsulatum G186AR]
MTTITTIRSKTSTTAPVVGDMISTVAKRTTTTAAATDCPNCGYDVFLADDHAHQRISELEAQIRFLNKRAAETADKLADYEDEIRLLRSKASAARTTTAQPTTTIPPTTPTLPPSQTTDHHIHPASPPTPQSRLGTFASLLPYGRRNATTPPPQNRSPSPTSTIRPPTSHSTSSHAPQPSTALQDALTREQTLRKEAESRLTQANSELEELTAQLFSQANEMVAQERKARAKLEERVEVLERRDREKRRRLERLEKAIERVDRVRGMVGDG